LVELLEGSRERPNYLGFRHSGGCTILGRRVRSLGFERDLGDSGTWVVLASPDLLFGIFLEVIGHFW
jgi:hypothetical protein